MLPLVPLPPAKAPFVWSLQNKALVNTFNAAVIRYAPAGTSRPRDAYGSRGRHVDLRRHGREMQDGEAGRRESPRLKSTATSVPFATLAVRTAFGASFAAVTACGLSCAVPTLLVGMAMTVA